MKKKTGVNDCCSCYLTQYETDCKKFGRESLLDAIDTQLDDVKHLAGFLSKNWKEDEDEAANWSRLALISSINTSLCELGRYIGYLEINWKEDDVR